MTVSTPILVTFSIYLIATIAIGIYAWYSTRTFDDSFLGGRSLGACVTAMSAGAGLACGVAAGGSCWLQAARVRVVTPRERVDASVQRHRPRSNSANSRSSLGKQ